MEEKNPKKNRYPIIFHAFKCRHFTIFSPRVLEVAIYHASLMFVYKQFFMLYF